LSQLCLYTIFVQSMSGTVKLKVYLTPNMFALRTSTVTTKLLNITSIPGITIVTLTGVVTGVMTNS
jgi:hypothetical protein